MTSEEEAKNVVDTLCNYNENFVDVVGAEELKNKPSLVKAEVEKALDALKSFEANCSKTFYLLQYCKVLNVLPDYKEECEECLSKVVKRDPSIVSGWNMLGETFWKKGDVLGAKNCFEGALKREKNKVSLRSLSMVLRQLKEEKAGDSEKNVLDSVTYAKEAVQLDSDDGYSWYILGNAYLSLFFLTQQNHQVLNLSLSCYKKSENSKKSSKNNPDVHFNRSQAHKYKEDFQKSLEDLHLAAKLDPLWKEPYNHIQQTYKYLDKITSLVESRGKLNNRRIKQLLKSFTSKDLGPYLNGYYELNGKRESLKEVSLSSLEEGSNDGKVIPMKVLCNLADVTLVPFTFIAIDKNEECFAVSVFNLHQSQGVIIGDTVAVANPVLTNHSVALEGDKKQWAFRSVRVENPAELVVNKKKWSQSHCAYTTANMTATDSAAQK